MIVQLASFYHFLCWFIFKTPEKSNETKGSRPATNQRRVWIRIAHFN